MLPRSFWTWLSGWRACSFAILKFSKRNGPLAIVVRCGNIGAIERFVASAESQYERNDACSTNIHEVKEIINHALRGFAPLYFFSASHDSFYTPLHTFHTIFDVHTILFLNTATAAV